MYEKLVDIIVNYVEVKKEDIKARDIVSAALSKGLILLTAEGNVIRMLPPLIAEKEDFDRMNEILSSLL